MATDSRTAMIAAIEAAPCSLRALAREAGVSHVLLLNIRDGERTCTPETVEKVAAALDRWGQRCHDAAAMLREAGGSDE